MPERSSRCEAMEEGAAGGGCRSDVILGKPGDMYSDEAECGREVSRCASENDKDRTHLTRACRLAQSILGRQDRTGAIRE